MGVIQMPLPPRAQQDAILQDLDRQTTAMSYRASLLQRSIALIEERRQALITAAVTGQLEIDEVA
jgi:type I restriction enzyme S subunit